MSNPAARPEALPLVAAAVPPPDAEWLLVDGQGGYACGSVDDLARRRYHGWWNVRRPGSARRWSLLAGADERIVERGRELSLQHAHWHGQPEPWAPLAQRSFERWPLPTWTFVADGVRLTRSLVLRQAAGEVPPCLCVRWQNLGERALRLLVRPLFGWCDVDHLPPADTTFDGTLHARGASWGVRPNASLPTAWLSVDGVAACRAEPAWYRGFELATDAARGFDHTADRWSPLVLELDLAPGADAVLAVALDEPVAAPHLAFAAALAAVPPLLPAAPPQAPEFAGLSARLTRTADDFFYRADGGRLGVLAGFPWFGEWGRDVFLALPGLTLARGQADRCREVLLGALPFLRLGLLPNIYGATADDSHYGSCDAALWFALAVQRFADAGHDAALVDERLLPALGSIVDAYVHGSDLGLAVDRDGLLRAGRDDLNATWMDARTAAGPVTPRAGLPVEIQAAWYSLLAFLVERGETRWKALRDRCGKAFVRDFWLADGDYLADRVQRGEPDRCVRPNMLIAAALARSPLTTKQRAGVVARATAELLTPCGLRTLSPHDPAYRGRFEGGPEARDLAYHQGTVWPWLAGCYVEAALRAVPKRGLARERQRLATWLAGFAAELERAGLDHVSEVFDGDAPQRPGGSFAQAWNSGELLRAARLLTEGA